MTMYADIELVRTAQRERRNNSSSVFLYWQPMSRESRERERLISEIWLQTCEKYNRTTWEIHFRLSLLATHERRGKGWDWSQNVSFFPGRVAFIFGFNSRSRPCNNWPAHIFNQILLWFDSRCRLDPWLQPNHHSLYIRDLKSDSGKVSPMLFWAFLSL